MGAPLPSQKGEKVEKPWQGQRSQELRVPFSLLRAPGSWAWAPGAEAASPAPGDRNPQLILRAPGSWAPGAEAASPAPGDRNPQLIPSASGHSAQEVIFYPAWGGPGLFRFLAGSESRQRLLV